MRSVLVFILAAVPSVLSLKSALPSKIIEKPTLQSSTCSEFPPVLSFEVNLDKKIEPAKDDRIPVKIFKDSTLQKFVCSRCKNATNEDTSKHIKEGLDLFDGYFQNLEETQEIFCEDTRFKLVPMMKQLTNEMKPCFLSPNETYLPTFIFEGFAEFIEFLCGNRTIEIFFSEQGQDCIQALREFQNGEQVKNCTCELMSVFNTEILPYDELCIELKTAEQCFKLAINQGCPYFAAFQKLTSKYFRAIGDLCGSGHKIFLNVLMLAIPVFLSLINLKIID